MISDKEIDKIAEAVEEKNNHYALLSTQVQNELADKIVSKLWWLLGVFIIAMIAVAVIINFFAH